MKYVVTTLLFLVICCLIVPFLMLANRGGKETDKIYEKEIEKKMGKS